MQHVLEFTTFYLTPLNTLQLYKVHTLLPFGDDSLNTFIILIVYNRLFSTNLFT